MFELILQIILIIMTIILILKTIGEYKMGIRDQKLTKREIFIMYDNYFKINNNNEIIKMFKFLGYYNIVCIDHGKKNDALKKYFIKNINALCDLSSDGKINSENIDNIIKLLNNYDESIVHTDSDYITDIDYKLKRSIFLSKHLIENSTNAFYYSLNDEEVEKIHKIKNLNTFYTDGRTFYF